MAVIFRWSFFIAIPLEITLFVSPMKTNILPFLVCWLFTDHGLSFYILLIELLKFSIVGKRSNEVIDRARKSLFCLFTLPERDFFSSSCFLSPYNRWEFFLLRIFLCFKRFRDFPNKYFNSFVEIFLLKSFSHNLETIKKTTIFATAKEGKKWKFKSNSRMFPTW